MHARAMCWWAARMVRRRYISCENIHVFQDCKTYARRVFVWRTAIWDKITYKRAILVPTPHPHQTLRSYTNTSSIRQRPLYIHKYECTLWSLSFFSDVCVCVCVHGCITVLYAVCSEFYHIIVHAYNARATKQAFGQFFRFFFNAYTRVRAFHLCSAFSHIYFFFVLSILFLIYNANNTRQRADVAARLCLYDSGRPNKILREN